MTGCLRCDQTESGCGARGWADTNYHDALKETHRHSGRKHPLYDTYHGRANGRLRFELDR